MCGIYAVVTKRKDLDETDQVHIDLLSKRGPDATNCVTVDLKNGLYLHMVSFVLHLRGDDVAPQPFQHDGNVLQWNGEIFGGIDVPQSDSDTKILSQKLAACKTDSEVCDVIKAAEGPWSFVYFQKSTNQLWFGRDYIGRRSLLFHNNKEEFILTSVARKFASSWSQVSADGIYKMDLGGNRCIVCHQWRSVTQPDRNKFDAVSENDRNYINDILKSVSKDSFSIPPPIKIFNPEKCQSFPEFDRNLSNEEILKMLLKNSNYSNFVNDFLDKIRQSVKKRVKSVPKKPNSRASVGVLFSGGIDCTVLALVADEFVPQAEPIVLLNVAFETPKSRGFDVPDRITGRTALKELRTLCPNRFWDFKEINVTIQELKTARNDVIADLTHPLVTVLDDSIGCALWFAARGDQTDPTSDTKVVLSGLGADEQLGGYSRHRSAFETGGGEGFEREIMMEIERLSTRNLGRDDRIVSHHGKEARFPYLGENVVSFLNETPTEFKANFSLKRGLGEKILLRAAGFQLGLRETALFPKRAIQFGSRIAKAECRKEKGSDICERLL